jgi:hypothetical protein
MWIRRILDRATLKQHETDCCIDARFFGHDPPALPLSMVPPNTQLVVIRISGDSTKSMAINNVHVKIRKQNKWEEVM